MTSSMDDIGRVLAAIQETIGDLRQDVGRSEGKLDQVLKEQENQKAEMLDHKGEDRQNFQNVSSRFGAVYKSLQDADEKREALFAAQGDKLDNMKSDADRAKGAGWVILGLLGAVATFVGGAVLAVLSGNVSIKFH